MRISDWSSDVCSSDLLRLGQFGHLDYAALAAHRHRQFDAADRAARIREHRREHRRRRRIIGDRSEEHTSELQSLMRISYAVFCLKKKKKHHNTSTSQPPNHKQKSDERTTKKGK